MRVLIFVVAYNAEKTVQQVLGRIPPELRQRYGADVLIIDDASHDATLAAAQQYSRSQGARSRLTILTNPKNQGYGGNQKLGYRYAIRSGYDVVALLHGDGQYAPEELPRLIEPIVRGNADAVFGSRMLVPGAARRGGMPLYKLLGNRLLTWYQNAVLRGALSEYHSGYRAYSVRALSQLPFERNTDDFHFDTEIIIQLLLGRFRICEVPIPTYYGDEICHVNGLVYAWNVVKTVALSRIQRLGILYDRRFDCEPETRERPHYACKGGWLSPHSMAAALVRPRSRVLDLGSGAGHMGRLLREQKGCEVVELDRLADGGLGERAHTISHDLEHLPLPVEPNQFDYVLLLDVVEHLRAPERFMEYLREATSGAREPAVLVSVPNVAFASVRLLLLLGQFSYGKRGILDLTHARLFTVSSLCRLFRQSGFCVERLDGVPAPWPLVFGNRAVARVMLMANRLALGMCRGLFSYQLFAVIRPLPTVEALLRRTTEHTRRVLAGGETRTERPAG